MELIVAAVLTVAVILYIVWVRPQDVPPPEPVSPVAHLEERRARIYEGLRDLQFEYRLGKLSDGDYQRTKLDLQAELAQVLAEIDRVVGKQAPPPPAPRAEPPAAEGTKCPHCGAEFAAAMKFCGECGKRM
jgi:hypothetical protein